MGEPAFDKVPRQTHEGAFKKAFFEKLASQAMQVADPHLPTAQTQEGDKIIRVHVWTAIVDLENKQTAVVDGNVVKAWSEADMLTPIETEQIEIVGPGWTRKGLAEGTTSEDNTISILGTVVKFELGFPPLPLGLKSPANRRVVLLAPKLGPNMRDFNSWKIQGENPQVTQK